MVWQYKLKTIVVLTKCVETGMVSTHTIHTITKTYISLNFLGQVC